MYPWLLHHGLLAQNVGQLRKFELSEAADDSVRTEVADADGNGSDEGAPDDGDSA